MYITIAMVTTLMSEVDLMDNNNIHATVYVIDVI